MQLRVCGRHEVAAFEGRGFSHMISVGDVGDDLAGLRLPEVAAADHLVLRFADVHDTDDPDAPRPENLLPLVEWIGRLTNVDGLLVHCAAGRGRAPAVALVALCTLEPQTPAAEHLERVVASAELSELLPNVLVATAGDALLSRTPEITSAVVAWRNRQGHPLARLPSHFETLTRPTPGSG